MFRVVDLLPKVPITLGVLRSLGIILLLVSTATPTAAQSSASWLIQNVSSRQSLSLDGDWNIVIDPYETGYYDYRYRPNPNGYFKDQKPENSWDLIEYDFDTGPTLKVPGDWNTQSENLYLYEGTVWYKKAFEHSPVEDERTFIYFGAANYDAIVYLNGELVGRHVGGFTPFNFEVTELLKSGENKLIVKVDNKRKADGVPTLNTDWWNYGGLTRSVHLISVPKTFVVNYLVQLSPKSQKHINGWVQLNGEGQANREIIIEIPDAQIRHKTVTDENGKAVISLPADLELWSPENPRLYDVLVRSETEVIEDKIGFRTIETRGEDILLNGEPIFLRGVSLHEEVPLGDGRANSPEHAATLLGWAKEMNCNFVRFAHYPHNENMVRMADKMGLLVWSEVPVYWTIQFENANVLQLAEEQVREMVTRDHNRAAVILWSVANETPASEARMSFLTHLAKTVRMLDNTRLVTAALDTQSYEEVGIRIVDPFVDQVDVIGVNSYCGWYGSTLPTACADIKWFSEHMKPVVFSEFGAGALEGHHGGDLDRWTEEYQASVYKNNLEMLDNISFIRGASPWILKDFRSPRRPLPQIQDFWNRKGLISDKGVRKQAFYIMKDWYLQKINE